MIRVITQAHPLKVATEVHERDAGASVAELLRSVQMDPLSGDVRVLLNDLPLLPGDRATAFPRDGDLVIAKNVPQGIEWGAVWATIVAAAQTAGEAAVAAAGSIPGAGTVGGWAGAATDWKLALRSQWWRASARWWVLWASVPVWVLG
jgi:hypothetical protein